MILLPQPMHMHPDPHLASQPRCTVTRNSFRIASATLPTPPPLHHPAQPSLNLILTSNTESNIKNLNLRALNPEIPAPTRPGLASAGRDISLRLLQALLFPDLSRLEETNPVVMTAGAPVIRMPARWENVNFEFRRGR